MFAALWPFFGVMEILLKELKTFGSLDVLEFGFYSTVMFNIFWFHMIGFLCLVSRSFKSSIGKTIEALIRLGMDYDKLTRKLECKTSSACVDFSVGDLASSTLGHF